MRGRVYLVMKPTPVVGMFNVFGVKEGLKVGVKVAQEDMVWLFVLTFGDCLFHSSSYVG